MASERHKMKDPVELVLCEPAPFQFSANGSYPTRRVLISIRSHEGFISSEWPGGRLPSHPTRPAVHRR